MNYTKGSTAYIDAYNAEMEIFLERLHNQGLSHEEEAKQIQQFDNEYPTEREWLKDKKLSRTITTEALRTKFDSLKIFSALKAQGFIDCGVEDWKHHFEIVPKQKLDWLDTKRSLSYIMFNLITADSRYKSIASHFTVKGKVVTEADVRTSLKQMQDTGHSPSYDEVLNKIKH